MLFFVLCIHLICPLSPLFLQKLNSHLIGKSLLYTTCTILPIQIALSWRQQIKKLSRRSVLTLSLFLSWQMLDAVRNRTKFNTPQMNPIPTTRSSVIFSNPSCSNSTPFCSKDIPCSSFESASHSSVDLFASTTDYSTLQDSPLDQPKRTAVRI